jgi:hypothetical protein
VKTITVLPSTSRRALTLTEEMAREHRRVAKLTRERDAIGRRLARARMRYSVLKRMANDDARRAL